VETLMDEMIENKPQYPISYMIDWLSEKKAKLPEVLNTNSRDPDFWRNYWQTDCLKW
jgi:hypothetical protein